MTRKITIATTVLAVTGLTAGAYYARHVEVAPEVATQPITRGAIVDAVGATGALDAVTTVQVGTQVSGAVQALYADFNSIVRQGQVVARLEPSLYETQVEQARANLVRAEADVERQRVAVADAQVKLQRATQLAAKNLIAATEREAAEVNARSAEAQLRSADAQVTQARASLNQAEVNLQKTVITTPIDGIVIARNVDVGQTVAASLQAPTLFLIAADLTKMRVKASIDEADVGRIRPGQRVRFRVDAFPAEEFAGTVSQIRLDAVVQQNVVTYAAVIDVPNPDLRLKPGMTANVTIEVARRDHALRVANAALRFRPTAEIFAALGQRAPDALFPLLVRRGEGQGEGSSPAQRASTGTARPEPIVPRPSTSSGRTEGRGEGKTSGATTIDALFGPVPDTESAGRIWLFANGALKPLRVRLGISDGTYTELRSTDLDEGADVVTSVTITQTTATPTPTRTTSNPLMGPQRPPAPPRG